MVAVHGRAYDVAARQWRPERIEIPFRGGVMHTAFEATPRGAVAWSEDGLFRFDAKKMAFVKLPIDGPMTPQPWCDGSAMCYDSKRDCLWLSARAEISRYDLATGKMTRLAVSPPAVLGGFALWREQAHLPEADLILLMRRFKIGDKPVNIVFDPAAEKYFAVEVPFSDGKEYTFSWSSALHYDPALKVALLHAGANDGRVWALRLDRDTLKLTELPPREAEKKGG